MNDRKPDHERMLDSLLPDTVPTDGPRHLPASAGGRWLREGWDLFLRQPLLWMLVAVMVMGIMALLQSLPFIGGLLSMLVSPILNAGLLVFALHVAQGEAASPADVLTGFRQRTAALVSLGGLNFLFSFLLLFLVVLALMVLLGQEVVESFAALAKAENQAGLQQLMLEHLQSFLWVALVGLALYVPLLCAMWFAPILVLRHAMSPQQAMQQSLKACVINTLPLLVYGLVLMGWCLLAGLLLGLLVAVAKGLAMMALLLVPAVVAILAASSFACYRQVFGEAGEKSPPAGIVDLTM